MKLTLVDVPIPMGLVKSFMSNCCDLELQEEPDDESDFEPVYKLGNDRTYVWPEMSYNRLTEGSLDFNFDFYANTNW